MAPEKHNYGVVLDAGSSGSRVYVYEYKTAEYVKAQDDQDELDRLPKIKTKKDWNMKVHPGISTFGETPDLVGHKHLRDLIGFAENIIPKEDIPNTPLFLLATAGMRLLPTDQRRRLLGFVCDYFQDNTKFLVPDCDAHIQVISGETEGLYGWIAANYLLGGFDRPEEHEHGKGHHTYGFLDMGGASAQIAFAPNATEAEKHANDLKLLRLRTVGGESMEHAVFVTTWLGFGANEARRRYVDHLMRVYPEEVEIPDPCLPAGLAVTKSGNIVDDLVPIMTPVNPVLVGTGQFIECLDTTFPLLEKDKVCADQPCLLNGVHTPAIDFDVNHFVGVSEYWHTTHEIFAMAHKDKAYDFATYQKQVKEFCSRDWASIEADVEKEKWGHKVDEKTVEEVCFKASWLINMLHDGIGIPRVGKESMMEPGLNGHENKTNAIIDEAIDKGFLDPFQAVDKIDDTEVSWTLGKMVLYASSQMPAAEGAMAVGFGSNNPGSKTLPSDFQYPSGLRNHPVMSDPAPSIPEHFQQVDQAEGEDWHNQILSSPYSRRLPGILIFFSILVLAAYLLYGRERRHNIWNKLTNRNRPSKRRKGPPGGLSGKLFGPKEPDYERVLEDGDPIDVEMADVDGRYSDSTAGLSSHGIVNDSPLRTGRTSGLATPSHRGLSPDVARSSPGNGYGYFDANAPLPSGSGLGITPFQRDGLIVRTESREHLAPAPRQLYVGRSQTSSPKRAPLSPFKESMD